MPQMETCNAVETMVSPTNIVKPANGGKKKQLGGIKGGVLEKKHGQIFNN